MSHSMIQHCPNCEAQAAEIERLRGKLREIEALPNYRCVAADMRKIARAALEGKAEQ